MLVRDDPTVDSDLQAPAHLGATAPDPWSPEARSELESQHASLSWINLILGSILSAVVVVGILLLLGVL
jgi:hypothetical protein